MDTTLIPSAYEPFRDHTLAHHRTVHDERPEKTAHSNTTSRHLPDDVLPHTRSLHPAHPTTKSFRFGATHMLRYVLMVLHGMAFILGLIGTIVVANMLRVFGTTRQVNQWDRWVEKLRPLWPEWLTKGPVYLLLSAAVICTVASLAIIISVKREKRLSESKTWLAILVIATVLQAALSLASGIYNHSFDTNILQWDLLSWTCSAHQSSDQVNFHSLCTELRIGVYTSLAFAGVELLALVFTLLAWWGSRKTRGKYSPVVKKY